jgi:hypothetical protein
MNNFKIISLFTLLLFFGVKESSASTFIDAASFGQMSTPDQIIIIDNARNLASQMEENLKVVTQSENQNGYQLYVKAVLDLIIKSSHAKISDKLIKEAKLCIYGGWVSVVTTYVDSVAKCTNPRNLRKVLEENNNIDPKIRALLMKTVAAHKSNKFDKQCGGARIICAPHLYGYKNSKTLEPFCGQSNTSPYNASLDCSRKVEQLTAVEKNENYNNIIAAQMEEGNASDLIQMFKIFYDVCACKGQNGLIEKSYAKKVFTQRTCYSWMKQNQLIMSRFKQAITCKELTVAQPNDDEFKSLFNWMSSADDQLRKVLEVNEENGTKFFDDLVTGKIGDEIFIETGKDGIKQNSNWEKHAERQYQSSKNQCSTLFDDPKTECKFNITPSKTIPGSGTFTLMGSNDTIKDELIVLEQKILDSTKLYTYDSAKKLYVYSNLKKDEEIKIQTSFYKEPVICEIQLNLNQDISPGKCKIETLSKGLKEKHLGYKITPVAEEGFEQASISLSSSKVKPEGLQEIKTDDGSLSFQFPEKQSKSLVMKHLIKYSGAEYTDPSCSIEVKGEKKEEKPADTFKVTIKEKEVKDKTVIYTIDTLNEGDIKIEAPYTGYTFKWLVRKKIAKKEDAVDESKEAVDAGMGKTKVVPLKDDPKKDDKDKEEEIEPTVVDKETGPEIELPKETEEYDVYVEATKGEEKKQSEPLKVPTLPDAKPAPVKNNANPFQQQMKTPQKAPAVRTKSYQGVF